MKSIRQDPTDLEFQADPYPFYERCRALGDIVYWDDYALPVAVSHAAVSGVLRDRACGRVPPQGHSPWPAHLEAFGQIETHSLLEMEPPRHTQLRRLVNQAFVPSRVRGMRPRIAAIAEDLASGFPEEPLDLLSSFATPLPVAVITELLGVPRAQAPDLLEWSHAMVAMYQAGRTSAVEDAAEKATRAFISFLEDALARIPPEDTLLGLLLQSQSEDAQLSRAELISTAILLLNAGHEATVHAIGNGMNAMLAHTHRPTGTEAEVEEVLRYDPPLHMFRRWVYRETTHGGMNLPEGMELGLLLAAANRDPKVWQDADRFCPDRKIDTNMSFGAGVHFCVGAPLARLELAVAFETLGRHGPFRAIPPARVAPIYHFRGLATLIVEKV